ncbi:MAG TPA: hydrogenase expression/formation protein HypA (modular protein), partial [Gammaproteobacteria bacterium]|nr:hydrogenase expression/formation protein HypA (modular protein) [Gammaproteobacteria bacterium]
MSPLGMEGQVRIRVQESGGRVFRVGVESRRPVRTAVVFEGRSPDQVLATLPLLFGVFRTAQTVAALEALEQAGAQEPGPLAGPARRTAVAAETAREHLNRALLDWPPRLGRPAREAEAARLFPLPDRVRGALFPNGDPIRAGSGDPAPDARALDAARAELEDGILAVLGVSP